MDDLALGGWIFEKSGLDWIGINTTTNRRTALKGSLSAAQADAKAGRYVCRVWPECQHRDPDACTRAIEQQRRMKRAA